MSIHDDEFDLDVRLMAISEAGLVHGDPPGGFHPRLFTAGGGGAEDTVAPQATCPAETCGLDCQTQTCPDATCGCNTSETCANPLCGSDAITFGQYCEDQSDDTCHACPEPGTGAGCIDPPD
jgi:hypothetical protein